jgi:hypothetical protein
LSEDREDGHRQVEQEIPTILQRLLLGAILCILVTSFEFAGLPWLSSAGSIWKSVPGIPAAAVAFGAILGVAPSWLWRWRTASGGSASSVIAYRFG